MSTTVFVQPTSPVVVPESVVPVLPEDEPVAEDSELSASVPSPLELDDPGVTTPLEDGSPPVEPDAVSTPVVLAGTPSLEAIESPESSPHPAAHNNAPRPHRRQPTMRRISPGPAPGRKGNVRLQQVPAPVRGDEPRCMAVLKPRR